MSDLQDAINQLIDKIVEARSATKAELELNPADSRARNRLEKIDATLAQQGVEVQEKEGQTTWKREEK